MNNNSTIKKMLHDLDLTDSVIETISFSENNTDLILKVSHFFNDDKIIYLKFKNCFNIQYSISEEIYKLNNNKLNFSHFTITQVKIDTKINIYTFDNVVPLLVIGCQDLVIDETDELL